MPKRDSGVRIPRELSGLPWITASGDLDLRKFPIDSVLQQALQPDSECFRSACTVLGSMCARGRVEAGVYLLGLLEFYRDELDRLGPIVENLGHFHTPTALKALLGELKRVKGSNSTRRYLDLVLRSLSGFPPDMACEPIGALAADTSLSPRMRQKLYALLDGMTW